MTSRKIEVFSAEEIKDMKNQIKQMDCNGASRGKIKGMLVYIHDLNGKDADNLILEVLGKSGRDGPTLEILVAYIRENYEKISKDDLIKGMVEHSKGAQWSTMERMYNHIRFAQEFMRQELEGNEGNEAKENK